jgi:formylglycine-generating enzyme required for sulfatase activity
MLKRSLSILLAFMLGLLSSVQLVGAQGRRVALVIGNSKYVNTPVLANPANDAADVAAVLRELGFEVIPGFDLTYEGMRNAVMAFSQKMEGADVGLLFYAGHGIQISDRNYLIPTDASLRHPRDVELSLLELDTILKQMERETDTRIIILDACRDNPLADALANAPIGSRRGVGRGLSQFMGTQDTGTYIAFATKPGHVASDGAGRNSPFTASLKEHIRSSRLNIGELMVDVRKDVVRVTNNQQVPWDMSSLMGPFYFNASAAEKPQPAPQAPAGSADADAFVRGVWEEVRAANQRDIYRAFIDAFPDTLYAKLARGLLGTLETKGKGTERQVTRTAGSGAVPTRTVAGDQRERSELPPTSGQTFRDCPDCPLLVEVPAGSYLMGSQASEEGRQKNEGPRREVRITRPFSVSVYEITVSEYRACVEAKKCRAVSSNAITTHSVSLNALLDGRRAVTNVSWEDARDYGLWLSDRTGWQYQLLSEAEWEYAARAGSTARFSWGDAADAEHVHCSDCAGPEKQKYSVIVGQRPANAYGLHDMQGNVWEWVADCWHKTYANAEFSHWPWLEKNEGDCGRRVLRGGSWANRADQLRSAYRLAGKTASRGELVGFRVARVEPMQEKISRFLEQYLTGGQTSEDIKSLYCEKVDFWGQSGVASAKVVEQQLRQNQRWPFRSYVMIPGTLRIAPKEASGLSDVYFQYNYRVSKTPFSSEEMRPGMKKGETRLKIKISDKEVRICAEDGSTL